MKCMVADIRNIWCCEQEYILVIFKVGRLEQIIHSIWLYLVLNALQFLKHFKNNISCLHRLHFFYRSCLCDMLPTYIFIRDYEFHYLTCTMVTMWSQSQLVIGLRPVQTIDISSAFIFKFKFNHHVLNWSLRGYFGAALHTLPLK